MPYYGFNSEDLSLEYIIVGTRGAGKTLIDVHFIREQLNRAWVVKAIRQAKNNPNLWPRKKTEVYSNFPVTSYFRPPGSTKVIKLESKPLNMDRLLTWAPEFQNCHIHFDEIDQIADRQDWSSGASKLLTAGAQMFRHRNISFWATIQSLEWLNARLQWQADVIIKMRDLAFTSWGRHRMLQPGEIANTIWIDKSGIVTGQAFEETGRVYPLRFYGKRYWGSYNTHHEFNILDYKRKWKLSLGVNEITTQEALEQQAHDDDALIQTVEYFRYEKPGELVPTKDFIAKAHENGCTLPSQTIGKMMLNELGAKRMSATNGAYKYDLSGIEIYDKEESES